MALDGGGAGEEGPAESRGGVGAGAGLGGGGGGGLGFVAAGAAGGGLGLGFTPAGTTPGLGSGGATPGLGSGGATPGLGLGADWGSETPGGAGLGLGATPMDATPAPSAVCCPLFPPVCLFFLAGALPGGASRVSSISAAAELPAQLGWPSPALMLHRAPERTRVGCTAQPASNPFEDFQRVFSKFASAEEVTGAAPAEDEDAAAEEDEKPVKEEVGHPDANSWCGGRGNGGRCPGCGAEDDEGPCRERR